jgi:hypothetical protein
MAWLLTHHPPYTGHRFSVRRRISIFQANNLFHAREKIECLTQPLQISVTTLVSTEWAVFHVASLTFDTTIFSINGVEIERLGHQLTNIESNGFLTFGRVTP